MDSSQCANKTSSRFMCKLRKSSVLLSYWLGHSVIFFIIKLLLNSFLQFSLTVRKVKALWRLGCPQSHGITGVIAISRDRLIIWHCKNQASVHPTMVLSTGVWLHSAIKLNGYHILWSGFLPRVSKLEPVIWQLNLKDIDALCTAMAT